MAYIHCHSCHWSQDDFWDFSFGKSRYWKIPFIHLSWAYNPISCFLSYLTGKYGYLRPRRIDHDDYCARDNGWKRRDPHSWWLIGWEFKRMLRKFKSMKWKTMEDFKKEPNKICPDCGKDDLDID